MSKGKSKSKAPKKAQTPKKPVKSPQKPAKAKEIKGKPPQKPKNEVKSTAAIKNVAQKLASSKGKAQVLPEKAPIRSEKVKPVAGSKPEWGTKRICPSCASRFYDMRKSPILCPKCGTKIDPEAATKTKRGRPALSEAEKLKNKEAKKQEIELDDIPVIDDEEAEEIEADEGDDMIEDAEELDDAGEELEVIDED